MAINRYSVETCVQKTKIHLIPLSLTCYWDIKPPANNQTTPMEKVRGGALPPCHRLNLAVTPFANCFARRSIVFRWHLSFMVIYGLHQSQFALIIRTDKWQQLVINYHTIPFYRWTQVTLCKHIILRHLLLFPVWNIGYIGPLLLA